MEYTSTFLPKQCRFKISKSTYGNTLPEISGLCEFHSMFTSGLWSINIHLPPSLLGEKQADRKKKEEETLKKWKVGIQKCSSVLASSQTESLKGLLKKQRTVFQETCLVSTKFSSMVWLWSTSTSVISSKEKNHPTCLFTYPMAFKVAVFF